MSDKIAFRKIYVKYFPQLLLFGRTISSDDQLIEDAIQDLFAALWQKEAWMINQSLEGYLYVSLRNNILQQLKKEKRAAVIEPLEKSNQNLDLESIQREKQLLSILDLLPRRQRQVLFLRYYKGHSYREISDILGISYQVARNFSHRGIQLLRKHMQRLKLDESVNSKC